jgi:hypothetical protein
LKTLVPYSENPKVGNSRFSASQSRAGMGECGFKFERQGEMLWFFNAMLVS